jgi:hypothetical protein
VCLISRFHSTGGFHDRRNWHLQLEIQKNGNSKLSENLSRSFEITFHDRRTDLSRSFEIAFHDASKYAGKLGGLVNKEQRYYRKTFHLWLGLLLTLICSFALVKNTIPPIVLVTAILLILNFNLELISNLFGWDRVPEINRYLLLPLRGRDILLVKNLGIAAIVAVQLLPLLLLAGWRFGWVIAGVILIEVLALLLAHLAWGNLCSVGYPHKEQFLPYFFGRRQ